MASFDDLGRALRDDASTNAPRASVIDVDAVISAARARRRPRQWAVGTLSIVAALGLGGLAVAAATPPTLIAATESGGDAEALRSEESDGDGAPLAAEDDRATDLLTCGTEVSAPAQSPIGLALEVQVPESAPASAGAVDGVVRIVNTGTTAVTIVTGTAAAGVLIRDGVIVSTEAGRDGAALEFTLGAGESRELPVRFELTTCETTTEQPLPAGSYQAVALLRVIDGSPTGLVVAPTAELRID